MGLETISIELASRRCPYCLVKFAEGAEAFRCDECGAIHHYACWNEIDGCTTFGCINTPRTSGLPTDLPEQQLEASNRTVITFEELELPEVKPSETSSTPATRYWIGGLVAITVTGAVTWAILHASNFSP